ncbi:MAG: hypothetical protein MK101_08630 [Phycisphaerales bacterium]|nr:hypothetical protein [Phycisphaerales bacterium]
MKTLLFTLPLLCAACTTSLRGHKASTHDESFTVYWDTASQQDIVVDEYFVVRARVEPAPKTVDIDATMPDHRHGMLHKSDVRQLSHDTWLASDMLFHMPGLWRVHFNITDEEGVVHRAESDVILE